MSNLDVTFKIPLPRGGLSLPFFIPTGAKHRVKSPLEGRPTMISMDRPEMESRPYEFLLLQYKVSLTHSLLNLKIEEIM